MSAGITNHIYHLFHIQDESTKWKMDQTFGEEGLERTRQQEKRDPYHGDSYPYVTIVIYTNTKKYDPHSSYVEVNPVRLKCHLVFPEQTMKQAESYDLDVDLYGVINDEVTTVNFLETKIEIIMKKSESDGCHWEKLKNV